MRLISYKINKILQDIHKDKLIFYIKYNTVYVIDSSIYVLKGLLKFKYCLKNGRKVIFISNNYLNYLLKVLRDNNVSHILIRINYGYNKVFEYVAENNMYKFYYKKGKRIVKNELKIDKLLQRLETNNNLDNIKKAIKVVEFG